MRSSAVLTLIMLFWWSEARPATLDEDRQPDFIWQSSRHRMGRPFPTLEENPMIYYGNRIIVFIGEGTWRCNYQLALLELMESPSEIRDVIDNCFVPSALNSSDEIGSDQNSSTSTEDESDIDDDEWGATVDNAATQTESSEPSTGITEEVSTERDIDVVSTIDSTEVTTAAGDAETTTTAGEGETASPTGTEDGGRTSTSADNTGENTSSAATTVTGERQ